ncbi:MAG: GDSL-type esterase/lipase family protein [Candidatus Omnitrophota bacterium]
MIIQYIPPQHNQTVRKASYRLNRLFGLIVFFFFLFSFLGCTKYEIKNIHSRGEDIICFGNSITAGSGASKDESYPGLLSKLLGYPIINAGKSGDSSSDGLRRLERDVLIYQPRVVIIEFGGNDFLRKLSLSQAIDNIQIMTEKIQAKGAMVAIVDISSGMIMGGYRKGYKKLARQMQAIFIPNLLEGIINNPSLRSDHIHPNAEGYKIIAERIYKVIKPYLEENKLE